MDTTPQILFHYKMNSGDIMDGQIKNYANTIPPLFDSTIVNSLAIDTADFKTGDGSLNFNGSQGFILPIDVYRGGPVSICFWLKYSVFQNWSRILEFGDRLHLNCVRIYKKNYQIYQKNLKTMRWMMMRWMMRRYSNLPKLN